MALSDVAIKRALADGEVVIHPYSEADLGSASYDVRLGRYYFEARQRRDPFPADPWFYNIYSERSIREVWGQYKTASPALAWKSTFPDQDWTNIRDDDELIVLEPHANLLCHTYEFIGARRLSTTMMKARSSIGRSLVNVCQCAGMGDVGYFNRWTMEVYNRSDWHIPLVVHRRIAQIVFLETGPTEKVYVSKYQGTDDLSTLEREWHPDAMLARMHEDRDVRDQFIAAEYNA
ncbi:MAG: hypothetical protein KGO96_10480 [Elusimicrobia bacterium]|nr:hypothetical protein [Elusimicrobiota bacterium]